MYKKLIPLGKWCLVAVLLWILSKKGMFSLEQTQKVFEEPFWFIGGCFFVALSTVISFFRWRLLLNSQNLKLSFSKVATYGLVGNFFNLTLPGAISGDMVKAWYVAKVFPKKRAKALSSIFFDRACGLSGLILLATGAVALSLFLGVGNSFFQKLFIWVSGCAGFVLAGFLYLFLVQEQKDPFLKGLCFLEQRFSKISSLKRFYLGVRTYHHQKGVTLLVLLCSILVHGCASFALFLFFQTWGGEGVSSLSFFILVPLGLLVTVLPLTPGGMGTGHAAFFFLFQSLGSRHGADVFNVLIFYRFLEGVLGFFIYLKLLWTQKHASLFKKTYPSASIPSESIPSDSMSYSQKIDEGVALRE